MAKKPIASVLGVLQNDRKEILLVKQKTGPLRGWWLLPGGHVKFGESVEEAIVREVKEETDFTIKICRLLGVFDVIDEKGEYHFIHTVFQCELVEGKAKARLDTSDIGWFNVNTLDRIQPDLERILKATGYLKL